MKKLLLITCLLSSSFVMAMPVLPNVAIQGFMQSEQFRSLLQNSEVAAFDFVNVVKVKDTFLALGHFLLPVIIGL